MKILQTLLLALVSFATVQAATVPTTPLRRVISGVQHTAWTPRDGAPAGIMAIEQSVDGALWLGSRQGLYRFDGLHFERITVVDEDPWSPADIYALHAMPNGDLWIGQFTGGGVILLHEGKVTRYKEGLPRAGVTQFLVHPRGGFWASTTQGLARFEGGRFHTVGPEMGLPVGQSVTCIFDADGNLIVRTFTPGLFVLHSGSSRFEHVEDGQMGYQPFAMDPQHRIWESTKDGAQLRSGVGYGVQLTAPWTYPAFPPDIRFDQTGMLWATERGFGVRRVRLNGGSAEEEVFDEKDGLTSVQVMCNFVDKDDDVWVGTERGLDRFHAAALTKLDSAIGSAYLGTQPGADGSAWIVAFTGGAWLRTAAGDLIPQSQLPQDVNRITAVAADGKGGIWLSAAGVVGHLDPTSWKPLPDSPQMAGKKITAIVNDQHGGFWAALNGTEIARYDSGTWSVLPTSNRLAVTALATDGAALYAGTRDGTLLRFDQDHQVRTYTPAVGAVTALTFSGGNLWIGGDRGVARMSGGQIKPLNIESSPNLYRVSAILVGLHDDLWLNMAVGVVRLPADQWKAVVSGQSAAAHVDIYDAADGVEGLPLRTFLTPTASLLTNGNMIFTTQLGLYGVDPQRIAKRNQPSTPYPVGLRVDGESVSLASTLRPNIHTLEIDYGAACLHDVQRLTFRYRLVGYDNSWQQAGGRRQAFYTDLPPGHYRFESQSSFDGSHWSATSTPAALELPPSFFQRKSVRVAALVAVLILAWAIFRWRIARVQALADLRIQERVQERERIAQDLHDTLLQSIQGVILRFGLLVNNPNIDESVRGKMHQSLALAEHVMTEGRDRVRDLRGDHQNSEVFELSLIEAGSLLSAGTTTEFESSVQGERRRIEPVVADELSLIAREAMHNAFQHAHAQRVSLQIVYGKEQMRVVVADDGVGIPTEDGLPLERPGHWGIAGMKERSGRIGARLQMGPASPKGTQVTITAPSAIAYRSMGGTSKSIRFRSFWSQLFGH